MSNWISSVSSGSGGAVSTVAGRTGDVVIAESDVTNLTTDLAAKAALAGPTFTGVVTLPTGTVATTQSAADNSTKLGTTAYVDTGLALKANLAGPTFTGSPVLPTGTTGTTQSAADASTKLATTLYADTVGTNTRSSANMAAGYMNKTLGQAFDPSMMAATGSAAFTSGILYLVKIPITQAMTIATLNYYVFTVGSSLTSNQCWAGIYNSSGTLIGTSTDRSTDWTVTGGASGTARATAMATTSTNSLTLAAPTTPTWVYAGFLSNGTTNPVFGVQPGGNASAAINIGLAAADGFRAGTVLTGQTTLPNITIGNVAAIGAVRWAGIS